MRSNLGWADTRWSTLWYFCDAQLIEITGATKIEIPCATFMPSPDVHSPATRCRRSSGAQARARRPRQPAEAATPSNYFLCRDPAENLLLRRQVLILRRKGPSRAWLRTSTGLVGCPRSVRARADRTDQRQDRQLRASRTGSTLLIMKGAPRRSRNLTQWDRTILGLCTLRVSPGRLGQVGCDREDFGPLAISSSIGETHSGLS